MTFRERWIDLLYRAATGTSKTRALLTPLGLTIFSVFTALFVLTGLLVDKLLSLPDFIPEGVRTWVSVPLIAIGAVMTAWSVVHFLKVKGTPVPFNPPPKVVSSGPYRYSRNPMVIGVFILLFGVGFAFNSISLVFLFTPLYVLVNIWELRYIEEPELVMRLGDEYVEYRNRTPMLIPRLSRDRG
jgi:protein-S-isoprenylcysteine O-methyltransferase Ste14